MNYFNQARGTSGRKLRGVAWIGLVAATAALLPGQTQIDLRNQSKHVDFTQAPSTAPVKTGIAPPATCAVGELFYNTDATPGQNLFACTAANTWTLLAGGSTAPKTGTGNPNGTQTCQEPGVGASTLYFDTAAQETWQCIAANTWRRILDTDGTGPAFLSGVYSLINVSAPSVAGTAVMQFGDHGLEYFPHGGALSRTVVPKDCAALTAGNVVSSIAMDGTVTCAPAAAVRSVEVRTAQIDSLAWSNLLASAPAGLYRASVYVHTTNPQGAACALDIDIEYTYNGGLKTTRIVSAHNLNSDEAASDGTRLIWVDNATNIRRALTDTCVRSAYLYNYTLTLERVN